MKFFIVKLYSANLTKVVVNFKTANRYAMQLTINSLSIRQLITSLLAGDQLYRYKKDILCRLFYLYLELVQSQIVLYFFLAIKFILKNS
jgi:hypothetical protein